MEKITVYAYLVAVGIFLRASVSLYPHSGLNKPPMFGDYEAQRHWQEITVNVKLKDWYRNTTKNNLDYWGLDYPPLTAYHSYILGHVAKAIDKSFIKLYTSRGIATNEHQLFMRSTVLVADLLIYIPSLILVSVAIYQKLWNSGKKTLTYLHIIICITYPGQILIDNGHFQYNNISLGLAAAAITFLLYDKNVLGAICFTCALNYKQMELYHALPFFCYLLGRSFHDSQNK